ncbi:MAG TPA: helix-turn-helix domain-containing protein [Mycobacteriales bacterium]|nr:helix-turn-helix domain-containing protein [Mycobacteriales bacterium]
MPDRSRDPLDHLIRSTVPTAVASAAPRRSGGTRSRAGNAMARTRAGLLEGARRAVGTQGTRRTTMNDIAAQAGVAKATLYNHFRTKDDVWSALVEAEVRAVAAECAELELVDALAHAARRLSEHPALRRVADAEPVALAGLLARRPTAAGWRAAEEAVRSRLAADGLAGDDLVLRWLASHLATPAATPSSRTAAETLARGLPVAPTATERAV